MCSCLFSMSCSPCPATRHAYRKALRVSVAIAHKHCEDCGLSASWRGQNGVPLPLQGMAVGQIGCSIKHDCPITKPDRRNSARTGGTEGLEAAELCLQPEWSRSSSLRLETRHFAKSIGLSMVCEPSPAIPATPWPNVSHVLKERQRTSIWPRAASVCPRHASLSGPVTTLARKRLSGTNSNSDQPGGARSCPIRPR